MSTKRSILKPIFLTFFGLFVGLGIVAVTGGMHRLNLAFGSPGGVELGGAPPKLPDNTELEKMNASFKAIAKAIQPVVVAIHFKSEAPKPSKNKGNNDNDPFHFFFHGPNGDEDGGGDESPFPFGGPQGPQEGLGSGVVISSDGYILTNNHVVENAAKKGGVTVKFMDNREYEGTVVGTDPTTDLAVVKIEAGGLIAAALGNSDEVEVGEMVLAVGNPLGLESTVTKGIVSSMGRAIGIIDRSKTQYGIENFIQTDAAINPGNSGGGLFNIKGQVIGINSAIATRTGTFTGYGFAIPINMAKTVAMDIIKYGKVNRGYIGINIRSVDQTEAEALGLPNLTGVRVDGLVKDGAAESAGIQKNDVILSVDGKTVNTSQDLQGIIAMHHAGDQVSLKIFRDGKQIEKVVKLKARKEDEDLSEVVKDKESDTEIEGSSKKESASLDNIGLSVRNLSATEKDKFSVKNGVMITKVDPGSIAYDRGLAPYVQSGNNMTIYNGNVQSSGSSGGVITEVARQPIKTAGDFEKIVNANKGKAIGITVVDSKGDSRYFAIKIPKD
jgi:serine protease Do